MKTIQDQIVEALGQYGINEVAFVPITNTRITAIRLTDQVYDDMDVLGMIAFEIIEPLFGLDVSSLAGNAIFAGCPSGKKGGAIMVYGL